MLFYTFKINCNKSQLAKKLNSTAKQFDLVNYMKEGVILYRFRGLLLTLYYMPTSVQGLKYREFFRAIVIQRANSIVIFGHFGPALIPWLAVGLTMSIFIGIKNGVLLGGMLLALFILLSMISLLLPSLINKTGKEIILYIQNELANKSSD